jgi:hypothetical protein
MKEEAEKLKDENKYSRDENFLDMAAFHVFGDGYCGYELCNGTTQAISN